MRTTLKERNNIHGQLANLGIDFTSRLDLRRIAMTLHNWHEKECGTDNGYIERDEKTGKPMWYNARATYVQANDPRCYSLIRDLEKGALKRLAKVMDQFPDLTYYVQTDPRGASLYILRKMDVLGMDIEQVYNRGVAVY